ncbi:Tc toxin subunit A-related protein [Streptomyces apocyni]|uniref:Tc toxin subunit A-related protein n=1 Tax=Streptomyces apocyni TaxID=2654677 RepID=UPI0012EA2BA4|nr:hypothetical protein [Streptomyces apocyni]
MLGQNDSGVFALDFHEDSYLSFERAGAISRWRLELSADHVRDPETTSSPWQAHAA